MLHRKMTAEGQSEDWSVIIYSYAECCNLRSVYNTKQNDSQPNDIAQHDILLDDV